MANKGKRVRRRPVAVPVIPTLISTLPEIFVGLAAAQDVENKKPTGEVGALAVKRLAALYGQAPAETVGIGPVNVTFDVGTNVISKVGGVAVHALARWGGMRIPLGRRFTLL